MVNVLEIRAKSGYYSLLDVISSCWYDNHVDTMY